MGRSPQPTRSVDRKTRDASTAQSSGLSTRSFYPAIVRPPLTLSTCPVMNPAAGDAKNATASAISSGVPRRWNGMARVMPATTLAPCSVDRHGFQQRGIDGAWTDDVHRHEVARQLARERLREADDGGLATGVDRLAGAADAAGVGGDADDAALIAGGGDVGEGGLRAVQHAADS